MKKIIFALILGILLIGMVSAIISYNTNFLTMSGGTGAGRVMTYRTGGTVLAYSNTYSTLFDYFDDAPSINDTIYLGSQYQVLFTGFMSDSQINMNSSSHTLAWEYFNGTLWKELPNLTASNNFTLNLTATGYVYWNKPSDWNLSNVGGYNYYWFRIRLVNYTGLTEGGRKTGNYIFVRPSVIFIGTGESTTPQALKNLSDFYGWNTIDFLNGFYLFKEGLYTTGGVTFTVNDQDIQIGTPTKWGFFGFAFTDRLLFNPKSGSYLSSQYTNFLKIYFGADFALAGNSSSEFNNMMINNPLTRLLIRSDGRFYNVNFGRALPYDSPKFERVNFNYITYMLTLPSAVYKNVYLRRGDGAISVDPNYLPVIEDSVFDVMSGEFLGRGYFTNVTTGHHFFKAIDCSWVQGNKFLFGTGGVLSTFTAQNLRHVYSHKFNLKVISRNGSIINGANITITDVYGNSQIFTLINNSYPTSAYLMSDTTIAVNNGSEYTVGKYYKIAEEIISIVNISGNNLGVNRGLVNTTPYRLSASSTAVNLYKSENSILTNSSGQINQFELIEYALFRYGDGVTSYMKNYTYYPYTLTMQVDGYKTYTSVFNLTEKVDWVITLLQDSPSFVLDKIATIQNFTDSEITYNITLKSTNKGGINSLNTILTDSDSVASPYSLGTLAFNSSTTRTYLKIYQRNSTTYSINLSIANITGQDDYSNNFSANSSELNIIIPVSSTQQQLTLIKNAYYNSENSTAVNYTITIEVVNSGGVDLADITLLDSDLGLNTLIDLNRTLNYSYSDFIIVDKAASNTQKTFVKSTATVNSITYSSNQLKVNIPGYGGPADAIVYAPSSVNPSTDFDTTITVENQNSDIGQDFVIDYWITNPDETTNYSSGQQTIYVASSGNSNLTATLTSPSSDGDYRFKALVTWVSGTATAYDTFTVTTPITASQQEGGGGTLRVTGKITEEIICNTPYIRYGKECCLDKNNNSICDVDEAEETTAKPEEEHEETIKKEGFSRFIKNITAKIKNFGSIISKFTSQNKTYFIFGLSLIILTTILIFLLKIVIGLSKKIKKKGKNRTTLKSMEGIEVYDSAGKEIGKIKEAYLKKGSTRIYGWTIRLNKNLSKKIKNRNILVKQKYVKSIGKIMIIDKSVSNFLNKLVYKGK